MEKINLAQKLGLFSDFWNPCIVGELNGQLIKLVRFKGEFTWHQHEAEDEMFLVIRGRFRMDFREPAAGGETIERAVWLEAGELIIVPRKVEHRPVAEEEVEVMLFEPATTLNTGNVENELTRHQLSSI